MDMGNGTTDSTTMTMMMKPYIHFTPGDMLYFSTWTPTKPGVVFGACFALFILAIIERSVAALGRVAQCKWTNETNYAQPSASAPRKSFASATSQMPLQGDKNAISKDGASVCDNCSTSSIVRRSVQPFILRIELQRGLLRAGSAILGYILMLAVMTFNAGFIFSTVIGLGVGEVLFGRFGAF